MADGFLSRWSRKKQLDQVIEQSGQVTTLQREDQEAVPGVDQASRVDQGEQVDSGPHVHQSAAVQPNNPYGRVSRYRTWSRPNSCPLGLMSVGS